MARSSDRCATPFLAGGVFRVPSCDGARTTFGIWFVWSSGASDAFRRASSLAFRGSDSCVSSDPPAEVALSRRAWSAPCALQQVPPVRGRLRSMLRLPGRSPPPSLTLFACRHARAFEDSSTGPHTFTYVQVHATLLTLTPLPTHSGPCHPVVRPGFLSWGCPKIAPPSFKPRSSSPGQALWSVAAPLRLPFGMGMPVPIRDPSSWFLTTSTVYSPRPCDRISGRCRSWGSSRFVPLRAEFLAMRLLPFEAFPPPTAAQKRRRISISLRARVTGTTVSDRSDHREPCPLVLVRTSRPCSIVGSVARPAVASRSCSVLPWACPIRPVAVLFASPRRER